MKTVSAKTDQVERKWFSVDLDGQVLGRIATQIATILRGKHKAIFTPHVDTGDFVVVVNADKVKLTGRKIEKKNYYHHSGYPGGFKTVPITRMLQEKPEQVIREAVRRMLPKNSLGRHILRKLKVYCGPTHPHQAQQPEPLQVKT